VWIATPLVFIVGLGWMVQMASTNTIIQSIVDPDMLGRVMSLYGVAFFGGMPLGALLLGNVADHIGPMNTFLASGAAVLACATVFRIALPRLRRATHPLYVRLGFVSE
jgi:predicted MFS family arabinose efflux permease